ncbi:GNAT family N-acetyltransferase [Elusimicrobiota bacterium]
MRLETRRLILRPFKNSDWKDIVQGIGDPEVAKFLAAPPCPYKKKDAIQWIKACKKDWKKKKRNNYWFAIELRSEKKIIGATDIFHVNHFAKIAKTGSWIAKKHQKKGYITEAKVAIFDFVFNKLKFIRIGTEAFDINKASNAMMKSLGHKYEGTARKAMRARSTGKWHDLHNYGLLKEDWKKARPKVIKKLKRYKG